jgi:hypothetical protein
VTRAHEAEAPELLEACTRFTGYDAQLDGERAPYLFDVLVASGMRSELELPILNALEDRSGWDLEQVLDLAVLFAVDGSPAAPRAIENAFLQRLHETDRPGAPQLVRAAGLDGLRVVARELGRVTPDWHEVHPLEVAEEHFGVELVAQALARDPDPNVARYMDAVRAYRERPADPRSTLPFAPTFEGLVEALKTTAVRRRSWLGRRWGGAVSEVERARAAAALAGGVDPALRETILHAFALRPFPGPPEVLLEAIDSGEEVTVDAAWLALRHIAGPAVRARSVAALERSTRDVRAFTALTSSVTEYDGPLLAHVVSETDDREDLHELGRALLDMTDSGQHRFLAPLLLSVAERGPCASCRHSLVKRLQAFGAASRELLTECQFDAELALRADAQRWLTE